MSEERMLPRVDPPESAMQAGMSAALVFDSSLPGPFSQPGPPRPVTWVYDFDPATGQSRATFEGEVVAGTISTPAAGVSSFNTRTGAVVLTAADVEAAGAIVNPSPALSGVPTATTAAPGTSTTQLATTQFVAQALVANAGVVSFNGRAGAINLTLADITNAGGAPSVSPALTGNPTAPTPPATDASSSIATTQYVQNVVAGQAVVSFNGRRGVVNLTLGDVTGVGGAPIASPAFTGSPTSTNPPPGDATTRIATTEFVTNAVIAGSSGVVSFNTRQGAVTLLASDISAAGGALLAGPVFTGQPEAPTPPANDASTRLATTQFVETAITSMAPIVTSFNSRTGAVSLQLADVTSVGGAPLASPTFTGSVSAPEPTPGDNSALVATTSFVDRAIAALPANVASFNGRTGVVTLNGTDITGAGGALQSSLANYLPLAGGTLTGNLAGTTISTNGTITCPTLTASIVVQGQIFTNPGNGAALLRAGDGSNYYFSTSPQGVGSVFVVNLGSTPHFIPFSSNATNFGALGGTQGPTGTGLQYQDMGGTGYQIFNDVISDRRIKENIKPTEVDALGVLGEIPVRQFDIPAAIAGWFAATGKTGADRDDALANTPAAHVAIGLVTQEISPQIPEAVTTIESTPVKESPLPADMQSWNAQSFIPYLVRAVQQLSKTVEELKEASKA